MAISDISPKSPHDSLFKWTFGVPQRAAALFRALLPESLTAAVDWATLEPLSASFVDERLAKRHADLLFSARMDGSELLLDLLFEHQSYNRRDMPLRLLRYGVLHWGGFQDRAKADGRDPDRLPPIVSVLLCHSPGGWTGPLSMAEMIDPDPRTRPELAPLVPNFQIVLADLAQRSLAELRRLAFDAVALLALVLLRDARDAAARSKNFGTWMQLVRELIRTPGGADALNTFLAYLDAVLGDQKFEEFGGKMNLAVPETEPIMRTYADKLREEGLAQGLARGLEQGREQGREQGLEQGLARGREQALRMFIVDLLELRGFALTLEHRARIAECNSLELLERWYAAAKAASAEQSLDQLLDEG